ncbi:MAG: T9SS type A sorting domain-containing protein [Bacteroidota bacterium]
MKRYLLFFFILNTSLALHAAIFTVTNADSSGTGSLREAIANAEATTDLDTIEFDLPGMAPHNIPRNGPDIYIFNPVYIDGDSQPANGYTGLGKKIIYSRVVGGGANGFWLYADNTIVKNIQFEDWVNAIIAIGIDGFTFEGNSFLGRVSGGSFSMIINSCDNGIIKNNLYNKEEPGGPCVGISPAFHIAPMDCSNLEISGNEICKLNTNEAILVRDVQNSVFQGNIISGDIDDCNTKAQVAISFGDSSVDNRIGGNLAGEANTFIGFGDVAIRFKEVSVRNLIVFNEFHCVEDSAIRVGPGSQNNKDAPEITFADAGSVIGTADPGDIIAVYRSADNATLGCGGITIPQSDLYYGEVTADGTGNWNLIGTFEGFITATARDANNNTSEFADVYDTGVGFTNTTSPCFAGVLASEEFHLQANYHFVKGTLLSWNRIDGGLLSSIRIQRSTNLERWIQVGRIKASETTDFMDPHPPAGHTYYRIQQVNEDGSSILSSVVSVFVDTREWTEVQVFPNPATDLLTIIPQNHSFLMEETTIELFSLQGKRVLMDKIEEASSARKIKIDHLPKGVYLLRINSESKMLQQKISIL